MNNDFPHDENGEVLRQMKLGGDNLDTPRDINFSVIFSDEMSAENFRKLIEEFGCGATIDGVEYGNEYIWDVTVVKNMVPTHGGIGQFESELEALARPLGGKNDGWGCFRQVEQ